MSQNKLSATYYDSLGNEVTLTGDSVEEIAKQLDENEHVDATVYDEPGFVRGWVHTRDDWRAQ